jgi:hypothetical protein
LTLTRDFPRPAEMPVSRGFLWQVHGISLHRGTLSWHFVTLTKH